ncbi:3-hydroxyacyl-CoA dehydrogenase/enoyl-CoA hydratase family protein [Corynebacterium sp. sy017]|uniref:3-hydroxyacyl-CoA dehydrogenase/enoyl-CoA hydratase family protein n=1 Tax=unclassified Corynebacterium TaxID=2624378 RepID=UPI001187208B|nr:MULTISPECIES: 3-hydroxyacyl-CoA dehydrogenase/enoyl-CoA hydratase family protein [unclassified Corynebacterium]MBP3088621.1 3-hydroxyacyl-CoA dehydrogenase/enoyl-CoA hydratase family protein [Corynebacterium sp. sy017]TSD91913.1 3-hydroxyacyl-CoA dehydrogenase/enoyl-CoA hydratase family protein [Corynebacterium sp. SY003]
MSTINYAPATALRAPIKKAAVLGAGSMGSGIAALLASTGIDVVLLDMVAEGTNRSERAEKGVEIQLKRRGFYHPTLAQNVRTGNTTDDLELLEDCDWVIEAIFEDLDAKHALYRTVEPHLKAEAILSSNTSTLKLADLVAGVPQQRREKFAITHFFNPPKIMRLVELICSEHTAATTEETLRLAIEHQLGKVALDCRDTPGFIANRVGCFWLAAGAHIARNQGVSYELADATFGKAFGIPRTGIFGLLDYIGLQLVPHVWGSLEKTLPAHDGIHTYPLAHDEFIAALNERGLTGRTGDGGFYRGRDEVINENYEYVKRTAPNDPAVGLKNPREVVETDSAGGRYAKELFLTTLKYCCEVAPEIADNVELIDQGLILGFGWKYGIFALADSIGVSWLEQQYPADEVPELLRAAATHGGFYHGDKVVDSTGAIVARPKRAGAVSIAELLNSGQATTIIDDDAASVHRLSDGIALLDLHTPLNSLSPQALEVISRTLAEREQHDIKALVIGNDESRAFCAGAFLQGIADAGASGDQAQAEKLLRQGSKVMRALRTSPIPIVGAVRGVALGGGAELLVSCDHVVVHADTKIGFPERNVGLFPGWTGTVATLERLYNAGVSEFHHKAFDLVAGAQQLPNAFYAREVELVRADDVIVFSSDLVLAQAIESARALLAHYSPRQNTIIPLYQGDTALDNKWPIPDTTETDAVIVHALAQHYTAEDGITELSFDEFCEREIAFDAPLVVLPANVERAQHMAQTRKPLKN